MYICSSRHEDGIRIVLESLNVKTPVLSTNIANINSIFPDEFLSAPNNLYSLKSFLEKYVDSIDLINQESIFEYVSEEFIFNTNQLEQILKKENTI